MDALTAQLNFVVAAASGPLCGAQRRGREGVAFLAADLRPAQRPGGRRYDGRAA